MEIKKQKLFKLIRELFVFGIVGGSAAIIDFGMFWLLNEKLNIYYLYANPVGISIAIAWTFFGNKYFTFRNKSKEFGKQGAKFLVVSLSGLGLQTLLLYLFVTYLPLEHIIGNYEKFVAKIMAIGVVSISNFCFNKFWTFRTKESI